MEYQEKILLLVAVLLMALAVYLALAAPVAKPGANLSNASTDAAEDLLLKGLSFGMGQANYVYAYTEVSDGYRTSYVLTKNGNGSLLQVQSPLSTKQVYFLSNDTVLCTDYSGNETCASVQNQADLVGYLNSLRAKFFSDDIIQNNKDDLTYLVYHGYIRLNPALSDETVDGHNCKQVSYVKDLSNISVGEAAHFGVSITSPKIFNWSVCVDDATGYPWETAINYSFDGTLNTYEYDLVSYAPGPATMTPPQNLSSDVTTPLLNEMNLQGQLVGCYTTKKGDARDECIVSVAQNNIKEGKVLCRFAGGDRDRCLVALVPVTKDVSICPIVGSQPYEDNCYIELAGAYKNSSWCSYVQNSSETDFCLNVSKLVPEAPVLPPAQQNGTSPQNGTAGQNGSIVHKNQTNSSFNVNEFLNYVDQSGGANKTNATAPANHS